ncbi:hypothetical protein L2E82_22131 [Cichorium intybus]|nr:hypothetical protein L2E82_22131 [Cichorium intybus]
MRSIERQKYNSTTQTNPESHNSRFRLYYCNLQYLIVSANFNIGAHEDGRNASVEWMLDYFAYVLEIPIN